ncbi:phosphatase PAP2 family protein [Kordiimonas sp.]|uniref:phosphatase PAP2 family protein n=1 Tax=Kordiimonas sp. TaxID=1970157 RepID=UPI003A8EC686
MQLPWGTDLLREIANYRSEGLTQLFQLFSELGEAEGYILVVTFIYVAMNRQLGFRLAVLVLLTFCLNHLLKTAIMNPRPFVAEGEWMTMWAASAERARHLVSEYSTPSGHAMCAAAFYGFLFTQVRTLWAKVASLFVVLLIGLSRPYLGVHYVEDILLGWLSGGMLAFICACYAAQIGQVWERQRPEAQVGLLVFASLLVWIVGGDSLNQPPTPVIGILGFLTAIVLVEPMERRYVGFEAHSGVAFQRVLRHLVTLACVVLTLALLGWLSDLAVERASLLGHLAKYGRYAAAGAAGLLLAPLIFVKLGLAHGRAVSMDHS